MRHYFLTSVALLFMAMLPMRVVAYNGHLFKFKMDNSTIYPGTKRNIEVYVPRQYDGTKPACLWVSMSGGAKLMAEIFDEMIASGELPVIVGVFISPGQIRNDRDEVVRYNRSNELDRMDGRYAHFIESEVLPAVCSHKTPSGLPIKISDKASDRAIFGSSSGGICAFNVAWQRPDLFSRVYSAIGTYISFRGGDQYPALVRKCEPRPIRVFLQDNDQDTWNPLFGSWFEYNELMLSALQFAGYDVAYKWDKGGHSSKNAREMMPEVVRWLWRDYPEPIKAGKSQSKTLSSMIIEGEEWRCIADDVAFGSMLHPYSDDKVVLQSGRNKQLVSISGQQTKCKGRVVLTDPYTALYPGGTHTAKRVEGSNWVWDYINDPKGGLTCGQQFYYLYADAGQILYDATGYLYVASSVGIQVCDQNGRVRTILSLPDGAVDSIAFADHHLFALCGNRLYVRKLLRSGKHNGLPKSEKQG
jgi:enterochelin esterase-like enzyme